MFINEISLIIPTYKREDQINQIIQSLKKQKQNDINLEIIICDSFSHYNLQQNNNLENKFLIKYFNIKKNILSAKRNYGINKASFKNIILLDDDCIPDQDFLKNYINDFKFLDKNTILSGIVEFPNIHIKKYNHIKFRNSRHFKATDLNSNLYLGLDKIVAMNMGFIRSEKFNKIGFFDEKFLGYGFEDYEFGYRCLNNGFRLKASPARIIHDEGEPDFSRYLKKYFHLGRDGMKNLINIDINCAKTSIYYKIETNVFFKLITKIPKFYSLLTLFEKSFLFLDKVKIMYIPFIYNLARLVSYAKGYLERNKSNIKEENQNWYE